VAWRIQKQNAEAKMGKEAVVALEFAPADLAQVEARSLARRLPVSGTLQPLKQAVVKAKVSGDVRQIAVREGEAVRAGQVLARIDTADLEARLAERIGATVRDRPFDAADGPPLPVTVSIGASVFPVNGTTAPLLLRAADAALYEAKNRGRDRWAAAAPVAPAS
jgi:multidrug efflux pump subunit AcrA (membrane-fusion protein)